MFTDESFSGLRLTFFSPAGLFLQVTGQRSRSQVTGYSYPNQQIKGNRKQAGVNDNRKQAAVRSNHKQVTCDLPFSAIPQHNCDRIPKTGIKN